MLLCIMYIILWVIIRCCTSYVHRRIFNISYHSSNDNSVNMTQLYIMIIKLLVILLVNQANMIVNLLKI